MTAISWLDLRRLTYFRAIAEAGSISEAARRLSVPQPALSYHLKELEAGHGGPLLERGRGGVSLTPAGQLMLDHATIILAQVARAEAELRQHRQRGPGDPRVLRLSAIPSLATALTPQLLQHSAGMPISGIYVIEANTREGREMLREGEVDAAITVADERTPEAMWLAPEHMLMVMAEGHPDRAEGPIPLAEALDEPLMLPARGKPVRMLVETLAAQIGRTVRIRHEIDGPNPRKQAVLAGLGRTFLPWIAVRDEVASGLLRVRPVVDPPLARHIALECRQGLDEASVAALQTTLSHLLRQMLR